MTVKQFFKSKSFQAILVLLCIALVSGALLSILNDVLYVSDTEKTQRAIKKVYGQSMEFEDLSQTLDESATNEYGTIQNLYYLSDGNYLIKSMGIDGYKKGTVTLWLVAECSDNEFLGWKNIVLESNDKQTLMSQFGTKFYQVYIDNKEYVVQGNYFETYANDEAIQNLSSGATFTSIAINNAVNCGTKYMTTQLLGG